VLERNDALQKFGILHAARRLAELEAAGPRRGQLAHQESIL
jgi:hypothetical protein